MIKNKFLNKNYRINRCDDHRNVPAMNSRYTFVYKKNTLKFILIKNITPQDKRINVSAFIFRINYEI